MKNTKTHRSYTQIVLLCLFSLFNINAVIHQGSSSVRIEKLLAEKQAKMKKLEKCQGTTKNLKIAGLSTLGITAAGVAVNVAEAVVLNKKDKELQAAKTKRDDVLEKNKGIAADKAFETWCGDKGTYYTSDKSCSISQGDDNITDKDGAFKKIKEIAGDECGTVSESGNTYTATCKKDGHDVTVTITGKAAEQIATEEVQGKEIVADKPAENTDDEKTNIDKAFKTACQTNSKYHLETRGSGVNAENMCYVQVSTSTEFNNALNSAKSYATKMKDVGCDSTGLTIWTDANGNYASDGKLHYFVNCKHGNLYNRFYVNFSNIKCEDGKEFKNSECVAKEEDSSENAGAQQEQEAPKVEEKVEAVAHNKDGSCDKRVFGGRWSYNLEAEDAKICSGMVKGEWKVTIDNTERKGVSQCSETTGTYAKAGNPVSTEGVGCWCRQNGAAGSWVFYSSSVSADNCAYHCAGDCTDYVLDHSDFRAAVFK